MCVHMTNRYLGVCIGVMRYASALCMYVSVMQLIDV